MDRKIKPSSQGPANLQIAAIQRIVGKHRNNLRIPSRTCATGQPTDQRCQWPTG
jgi:hypothetical protein